MVLLDCSASNQQTTFWRIQENWGQHESGFPNIPIVRWFRSGVHTLSFAARMKRVLMWGPLKTETAFKHGKPSWEHEQLGMHQTSWISLLEPTFTSPDPRINIRQWTRNGEEHATRTGERESDGIWRAVYMNKMAPQDMRQHLMLNQPRLSTADEVAQEIEDYLDATDDFSRDDKNQAGFIGPVGTGFVKGGKPGGVPHNFGKAVAERVKEKFMKDLGFEPERGEQRKFGGYCNWCWRIGHKEARRWFKQGCMKSNPSQDPLQRDKWMVEHVRERARSPPAQGKIRKRQGQENTSRWRGTRTRTRLDLRTKMDSARWVILASKVNELNLSVMSKRMLILRVLVWIEQFVSCVQKCNSVSMDPTELPSSQRESAMGMRSQRALIKNSISQRERYFSPLDVEMINQLLILEVLCPPVQWLMRHRFRLRKCNTVWIWGWSSLICVSGSWCAYMCVSVWVHFGSILGPFWVHFGSILGPFWVHFGSILGPFLGPFLGPMGVQWGSIWGMFCVHFGSILGPFCLLSECWRILKVQGFNQHSNKNRYLNKNQYLHKNQ